MEFRDDGLVTVESPPQFPAYTAADFVTSVPYDYLCENYAGSDTVFQLAALKMAENAKAVGISKTVFNAVLKNRLKERRTAVLRAEVDILSVRM